MLSRHFILLVHCTIDPDSTERITYSFFELPVSYYTFSCCIYNIFVLFFKYVIQIIVFRGVCCLNLSIFCVHIISLLLRLFSSFYRVWMHSKHFGIEPNSLVFKSEYNHRTSFKTCIFIWTKTIIKILLKAPIDNSSIDKLIRIFRFITHFDQ